MGSNVAFDAMLTAGKNIVLVKVSNVSGKAEDQIQVNYGAPQTQPMPSVNISDPAKLGKIVETASYTIKATTKEVSKKEDITIKLNGKNVSTFSFEPKFGQVSFNANLTEGQNQIVITVKNGAGSDEASTTLIYQKNSTAIGKLPEIVTFSATQPVGNPMNPTVAASTVSAVIKNIADKKEISLTVNGTKIENFTFLNKMGSLSATVPLSSGANKIVLKVTNKEGSDEKSTTINF